MLEDAVRIEKTHKLVYVVANNAIEAEYMAHMLTRYDAPQSPQTNTPT